MGHMTALSEVLMQLAREGWGVCSDTAGPGRGKLTMSHSRGRRHLCIAVPAELSFSRNGKSFRQEQKMNLGDALVE